MNRIHRVNRHVLMALLSAAVLAGYLPAKAATADGEAAARIVAQGTPNGAIACARCHGFEGVSDGSGAFPALAGQTAHYLANQLQHFASGSRRNAIMEPIAKKLTPEQIKSVAQYYANADPPSIVRFPASPDLVARGKQLALIGDASARVQNCVSCHGPNGEGEPPTVPYLAGQYKHYIQVQLQMFNKGYRTSDQMARVAHNLPEQHVEDIAAYFDQLQRPSNQINKEETWNKPTPNFQVHSTTAHSKY